LHSPSSVVADADDVDLHRRVPVLADLDPRRDALAREQRGQRGSTQALEALPRPRVELGRDEGGVGLRRAALRDEALVWEHEAEPEPEERVVEREAHLRPPRRRAGERVAARHVAQLDELLEVVVEAPLRDARLRRDVAR
jgi:hypothetical protein